MLATLARGGSTEKYFYTADDERIWTYISVAGVNTSRWTLRGLDAKVLREWSDGASFASDGTPGARSWTWQKDYLYRDGALLSSIAAGGVQKEFHPDHLGSPRLITDSTRAGEAHEYYPYGEEVTPAGSERMKFTGHERDTGNGVDYMHARYYRTGLGRFLGVDPVRGTRRDPQSWNAYAYVTNDPMNSTDPTGIFARMRRE